jgi:hypothetical protein
MYIDLLGGVHMVLVARGSRWLVILTLVVTAGVATLIAQRERPTVDDSMGALVAEIRALRLAVERSMTATSQAQLLLGRVQLQENRLATLGRQLQEARMRFLDAQGGQAEAERQLRNLTEMLESATPGEERTQAIQQEIPHVKERVKEAQLRTEQLRVDYTAAADALSAEQTRWTDFNERLEALERTLASQATPQR